MRCRPYVLGALIGSVAAAITGSMGCQGSDDPPPGTQPAPGTGGESTQPAPPPPDEPSPGESPGKSPGEDAPGGDTGDDDPPEGGDGDEAPSLEPGVFDCNALEVTGSQVGQVPRNLTRVASTGREVSLHDYCNETLLMLTGTAHCTS